MKTPRCFLILAVLAASQASGREIHVDCTKGADTNAGSGEAPFATLGKALELALPGDKVVLAPGIYREMVAPGIISSKERPLIIESLNQENPAILSGADAVTGWKPVAGSGLPEAGHPNSAELYYVDLKEAPEKLYVGSFEQPVSRAPLTGWFPVSATDGKTLESDQLASLNIDDLTGADAFFFLAKSVKQQAMEVETGTNAKSGKVQLRAPLFNGEAEPYGPGDRFILRNHISFISEAGMWAAKPSAEGYRVFWWPREAGDLEKAETPRRANIIDLSKAGHVVIRNLQIRHAAKSDAGSGVGVTRVSDADAGLREGLIIEGCAIYQNQRFAVLLKKTKGAIVRNNLVVDNSYGVMVSDSRGVLIERNQIAWNLNDGLVISWDMEDVTIRRNVVHHHSRFAHPDNLQSYRGVKNVLMEDNVVLASGQGFHSQETVDLVARNNLFGGSSANLFFVSSDVFKKGGPEKKGSGFTVEGNTFALFPNAGLVVSGANHTLRNNVFEIRSSGYVYGGKFAPGGISSTDNLFWAFGDKNRFLACVTDGKFEGFATLEDLQSKTGLETNSVFKDPVFASVPVFVSEINGKRIAECTAERLFVSDIGIFQPGDHVEYDFDGVDRIVKEADADSILISPPLKESPVTTVTVMQWGKNPVKKLDLTQTTGKGANLDVESFFQGDFNADGRSDVPPWPPGIKNPRQAPAR